MTTSQKVNPVVGILVLVIILVVLFIGIKIGSNSSNKNPNTVINTSEVPQNIPPHEEPIETAPSEVSIASALSAELSDADKEAITAIQQGIWNNYDNWVESNLDMTISGNSITVQDLVAQVRKANTDKYANPEVAEFYKSQGRVREYFTPNPLSVRYELVSLKVFRLEDYVEDVKGRTANVVPGIEEIHFIGFTRYALCEVLTNKFTVYDNSRKWVANGQQPPAIIVYGYKDNQWYPLFP